jgi:hypothetical protein
MPIDEYIERGKQALQRLIETPIANWETSQWLLAAFLALLLLWCCGCISQGRRRYRGRYYNRGVPGGEGNYYNAGGGPAGTGGGAGGGPWLGGSYMGQQQRGAGGGICGCVRQIVLAACCFEFCCRDCQDVNQAILGKEYSLKGFGDGTIV